MTHNRGIVYIQGLFAPLWHWAGEEGKRTGTSRSWVIFRALREYRRILTKRRNGLDDGTAIGYVE